MKYKWQGQPVDVEFGMCVVKPVPDKKLWGWNYECRGSEEVGIPAILITTKDEYQFMIANHYGIGIHKLKNGGSPKYMHFSLGGEFHPTNVTESLLFDQEGFEEYEQKRQAWQKEQFPGEYREHEALLAAIEQRN